MKLLYIVIFRYINYAKTYRLTGFSFPLKAVMMRLKDTTFQSLKRLAMVISGGSGKSSRNMLGIGGF